MPRYHELYTATAHDIERKFQPPMTELEELELLHRSLLRHYRQQQRRRKKKQGSRHTTPMLMPAA